MDELDKVIGKDSAAENGFDYEGVFSGATTEEAERRVSGKTVPSFPLYVVHFGGAKAGYSTKKGTPFVRPYLHIRAGLDGTAGDIVSDDLYLSVSKTTTDDDNIVQRKSAEKFKEDAERLVMILNKIARVGGFGKAHPAGYDKTSLDAYAEQFAGPNEQGFDAIVEIRETTEEFEGRKRTRNRIIWESLAALDDPADAKKLRAAGKTALDEALLKIEERNAAEQKKAKSGTAGSTSRTDPTTLFS